MKISSLLPQGMTLASLLAGAGAASAASATYRCSDGTMLSAQFTPASYTTGKVDITFGKGRSLTLPQVVSVEANRGFNIAAVVAELVLRRAP